MVAQQLKAITCWLRVAKYHISPATAVRGFSAFTFILPIYRTSISSILPIECVVKYCLMVAYIPHFMDITWCIVL